MNNEIKEILEHIQYVIDEDDYWEVTKATLKPLSDYITNLQQENERLKDNYNRLYNEDCKLREQHNINDISLLDENYDYKSRIDKAIEYFKYQLENLDFYEDTKAKMLCAMGITLLQNGGEE